MTHIPYVITDNTVTVFIDGKPTGVLNTPEVLDALRRAQNDEVGALQELKDILNPAVGIKRNLSGTGVKVEFGNVTYRNESLDPYLVDKILEVAAAGLDVNPWKKFVVRLSLNPSETSRQELYLFLEKSGLPITEDGCFLAYKRVNGPPVRESDPADYTDCHTGTFDNSVGSTLEMPRHKVDDNRNNLCSSGFHVCSKAYLKSFYGGRGRIVICKVDPADVVSVPSDYDNTKGRVWRYTVVDEVDTTDDAAKHEWGIYSNDYGQWDSWDDEFDDYIDEDWDEDDESEEWVYDADDEATVWVAERESVSPPITETSRSWWRRARENISRLGNS